MEVIQGSLGREEMKWWVNNIGIFHATVKDPQWYADERFRMFGSDTTCLPAGRR